MGLPTLNDMISEFQETTAKSSTCRHGIFRYPMDAYIGRSMDVYGEYSEQEVTFLCSLLKPGDTVVEVGANIGTITVPLAHAVGDTGVVFAYEPQADIYEMLRTNLNANAPNATPLNLGLGRAPTVAHYDSNRGNTGGVKLAVLVGTGSRSSRWTTI